MSPQALARLSEYRRSMATVSERGTTYSRWYRCLFSLFISNQEMERFEIMMDASEGFGYWPGEDTPPRRRRRRVRGSCC